MALLSDYTAGTVTVSAGGTAVTGSGTAWLTAGFREGDEFFAAGWHGIVQSVNSNTSLTLYPIGIRGAALSGAAYRLRFQGDNSRVTAQARQLIELLGGTGNFEAFAGLTGAADKFPIFTGAGTMDVATLTAFFRGLMDATDGPNLYGQMGEIPNAQLPARLRSDPPSAGTDLNALTTSGFYQVGAGAANIPEGGQGTVIVGSVGNGATSQIFTRLSNGNVWTRTQQAGSWTDWRRLSADRGSNANGEYVRFGDGTQICTQTDVTLGYSSNTRLVYAWTFPATFPGGVMFADVMLPAGGSNFQNVSIQNCGSSWSSRSSVGGSQIGINNAGATNFASNTQVSGCSLIAVGRWF